MKRALCILLSILLLSACPGLSALAVENGYEGKTVILYTGNIGGEVDLYPQIAQAKKDYEAKGADVILADVGNYLQGSAAANTDRGESIYALMEAAGYDVAGMGLGEFGYTDATTGYLYHGNFTRYHTQAMLQDGCEEETYAQDRKGEVTAVLAAKAPATFQTVCSNVAPHDVYSFRPWVDVTTEGGLTVRFLGIADPAIAAQVQTGYVVLQEPAVTLDLNADVTVTLSNDPAESTGETVIRATREDGMTVGALVIDNAAKTVTAEKVKLDKGDETVAALAEEVKGKAAEAVGKSEVILNGSDAENWNRETNLGDLTTDALAWYAENYVDGIDLSLPVVAIQNGGNCDNFLYPGEITQADLLRALPFSPMGIGVLQVSGAELLETLEAACQQEDCPGFAQVSGLSYTVDLWQDYDGGAAYGKYFEADSVSRVTITQVGGEPFDPAATYNLVCDNFLINGNDTYYTLKAAKEAEGAGYINNGGGMKVRDIVASYIWKVLGGTVGETYAQPQGRISVRRFADVKSGSWYATAVDWAVEQEITQGTAKGTFSPERPCTVGEILTFLWRAMGREESKIENPFAAMTPDDFFYKSALWAYERGMLEGESFESGALCTREKAILFLWQAAGRPEPRTKPVAFADMAGRFESEKAVLWAVEQGITTGTSETAFSPDTVCDRGQIVTLLQRFMSVEKGA